MAGFLQQFCWMYASVRQTNRLRRRYLAAVLRQDVAFFDTQATTGGLLQGLSEDALAVQQAINEKVCKGLHWLAGSNESSCPVWPGCKDNPA